MNLTSSHPKRKENLENKINTPVSKICRENIRHDKFLSKHQIWC